ncbi:MAG: hypothetical protein ACE5KZ_00300 [Candidatus Scalinduaceae bacterium]
MKTILKIIPVIMPALFLLIFLSACKTTSNQVSSKDEVKKVKVKNVELSKAAVTNNPQSQKKAEEGGKENRFSSRENEEKKVILVKEGGEQTNPSNVIRKRGIKRKNNKIIVKNQTKSTSKATISVEVRNQMIQDAKRATKERRYEDAIKIADTILKDLPDDKSALALKENAQLLLEEKRHNVVMDQLEKLDAQERNVYFENLREKSIPYNDLVKYTTKDKWEDIKKRAQKEDPSKRLDENREHTERLQLVPSPAENLLSQRMKNALSRKMSIEFIDTPLRDVIAFLQEKTKINFVLDKGAAATNVNLKLNDVPVSVILEYILPNGIDRVVKDNVVHITLEPLEMRVYDVRDLLINLEDRQGALVAQAVTRTEEGLAAVGEDKDTFDRVKEIIDLITGTIKPKSWTLNGGRGMIAAREGMLGDIVVTHIQSAHKQIEDLLSSLRSSTDLQISIEARFIAVSDDFLEELGNNILDFDTTKEHASRTKPKGSEGMNPAGGVAGGIFREGTEPLSKLPIPFAGTSITPGGAGLNLSYQILNGFFLKGFLRAVQESEEAETLTAPKITLSNTQRGTIKVVTTFNFIERFEIVSQTPEPIIQEIDDGTTFNVRPIVSADRKYVYLEVHPIITRVTFTERDFETTAAGTGGTSGGEKAVNKIQLPQTVKQELSVTVCVPDKGVLLIGGLGSRSETKTSSGTPFLSKIPIVKRLFSSNKIDRDIKTSGNLIILIKPTILMRDEEENRAFALNRKDIELRRKGVEFRNPLR